MPSREPLPHQSPGSSELPVCPVTYLDQCTTLYLRTNITAERFREDSAINPLGIAAGRRFHVSGVFQVRLPVPQRDVYREPDDDLFPSPSYSAHAVGSAQGWYYPEQDTMLLWSLLLTQPNQPEEPTGHPLFTTAWRAFEELLMSTFPEATTLATPSFEPSFPRLIWQRFLTAQGYQPDQLADLWYKDRLSP